MVRAIAEYILPGVLLIGAFLAGHYTREEKMRIHIDAPSVPYISTQKEKEFIPLPVIAGKDSLFVTCDNCVLTGVNASSVVINAKKSASVQHANITVAKNGVGIWILDNKYYSAIRDSSIYGGF